MRRSSRRGAMRRQFPAEESPVGRPWVAGLVVVVPGRLAGAFPKAYSKSQNRRRNSPRGSMEDGGAGDSAA